MNKFVVQDYVASVSEHRSPRIFLTSDDGLHRFNATALMQGTGIKDGDRVRLLVKPVDPKV